MQMLQYRNLNSSIGRDLPRSHTPVSAGMIRLAVLLLIIITACGHRFSDLRFHCIAQLIVLFIIYSYDHLNHKLSSLRGRFLSIESAKEQFGLEVKLQKGMHCIIFFCAVL